MKYIWHSTPKNHRNASALKIPHIMICTVWNWMWTFWIIWEGVTGLPSAELCAALRFWRSYWLYNTRSSPLLKWIASNNIQWVIILLTSSLLCLAILLNFQWFNQFFLSQGRRWSESWEQGFFAKHWRTLSPGPLFPLTRLPWPLSNRRSLSSRRFMFAFARILNNFVNIHVCFIYYIFIFPRWHLLKLGH